MERDYSIRRLFFLINYFIKAIVLGLIIFYKRFISPILPNVCKYQPTCSQYALESIERFGILKGCWMAVWRILRCNPFSKGGYDPVPEIEGKVK